MQKGHFKLTCRGVDVEVCVGRPMQEHGAAVMCMGAHYAMNFKMSEVQEQHAALALQPTTLAKLRRAAQHASCSNAHQLAAPSSRSCNHCKLSASRKPVAWSLHGLSLSPVPYTMTQALWQRCTPNVWRRRRGLAVSKSVWLDTHRASCKCRRLVTRQPLEEGLEAFEVDAAALRGSRQKRFWQVAPSLTNGLLSFKLHRP
jgi:hypothetical protein